MTQPERRLEMVHFQITKQCNLRCWFCGQWGEKGAFPGRSGQELSLEEWLSIADEIEEKSRETGELPSVILWGGEPMVSPIFEPLARELAGRGFPLGLVTNGTQLDRYVSLCREAFRQIYVSLDGTPKLHDAVRGTGVYRRVEENLRLLRGGKAKITLMAVMTEEVRLCLKDVLDGFEEIRPDEVLLQERIALTPQEAKVYQNWLWESLGQKADGIEAWVEEDPKKSVPHQWYEGWLAHHPYPFPVRHLPHGEGASQPFCLSPWRHLHVAWDGTVGFCTDFTDFHLGNVRCTPLMDLFKSDRARVFADAVLRNRCPVCRHCSWKNSLTFRL